jgi:hypothetical protein
MEEIPDNYQERAAEMLIDAHAAMDDYFKEMDIIRAKETASTVRLMKVLERAMGKKWVKGLRMLIEDCECVGVPRITRRKRGSLQKENYGPIKQMWVSQRSYGMEGDSWVGEIWVELTKGRYLELPFSC